MKLTPRILTVTTFVMIAALATGFLFKRLFAAQRAPPESDPRRQVPMATAKLEVGTRILQSHLGEGQWKSNDLIPDTILSLDASPKKIFPHSASAS